MYQPQAWPSIYDTYYYFLVIFSPSPRVVKVNWNVVNTSTNFQPPVDSKQGVLFKFSMGFKKSFISIVFD